MAVLVDAAGFEQVAEAGFVDLELLADGVRREADLPAGVALARGDVQRQRAALDTVGVLQGQPIEPRGRPGHAARGGAAQKGMRNAAVDDTVALVNARLEGNRKVA